MNKHAAISKTVEGLQRTNHFVESKALKTPIKAIPVISRSKTLRTSCPGVVGSEKKQITWKGSAANKSQSENGAFRLPQNRT